MRAVISDGYTLALASDVEKSSTIAAIWTNSGATFTYTATSTSAGYKLYDNKISYITASGGEQFTLTGLKDTSAVTVSGKVVIIGKDSLNGENVTISDGYTLALDGVTAPITTKAQWHGTTYKSEYVSVAGYTLADNKVTYTAATNPIELFSLSGIDSANDFEVTKNGDNYIVNIANLRYDASKTITLDKKSSNVHFAYADNFTGNKVQTIAQATSLNNGIYTSTTYQAWSELDDDTLTISPATIAKTFTISGLGNGAELGTNVVISENKVTINNGALNSTHEKISVSDPSYTLEVTASPVKAIDFAQNGNKVTLNGTTAGYKKVNGEYVWQEQVGGESLTITGLNSDAALTEDMFTRNGNVITFKPTQDLLPDEPTTIKISNGVIDTSALSTTGAVDAHWSGTTYVSAKTASNWTTGTSSVIYTPAAGDEELFTIDGVKSVNGITPTKTGNSYKVTLPATAFNKSGTITVTKKNAMATLEFEGIGTTVEPIDATLTKDGVYKTAHTPEYFATSTTGDVTTYTYKTTANDYGFTISGLNLSKDLNGAAIDEYLTFNNGTVTVKKLGTNDITLSNIAADGDNDGTANITIKLALEKDVVQAAHTFNTGVALIKSSNDYVYTSAGYKPWYELSDTKITYHPATGGESLFTISGLGTATLGENIIVDGTTVKVSGNALAQKNVSITGDYTLTLGKVANDEDFVFYGNNHHKSGAVTLNADKSIDIDLEKVPRNVERISIAATIYEADKLKQDFSMIRRAVLKILGIRDELANFPLENFTVETAIVLGEVYRYKGAWKFNATGAGFNGGLAALCQNFGVEIQ